MCCSQRRQTFPLVLSLLLLATAPPDPRFGVVESPEAPERAAELGIAWTRVRFAWNEIQPNSPEDWNPPWPAERLEAERQAGREIAALVIGTPVWARADPQIPGVPRGLYEEESRPENLWAAFLRRMAATYPYIRTWIIWNEPDIWDPAYPGYTWGGTEADFVRLLRVAYRTLKGLNRQNRVLLGAFTYWWDAAYGRRPYFERFLEALDRDPEAFRHNRYFDGLCVNLYFNPDSLYDLIRWHRNRMRMRGFDKPIWLTETNAAPSEDPTWPVPHAMFRVSMEEQAAFIGQALALALAAGVERLAIYKLIDNAGDRLANPEPFGLVREDGSPRPAFQAYRVAIQVLAGFRRARLVRRDLVTVVEVQKPNARVWIAWSRTPLSQTVILERRGRLQSAVDGMGNAASVESAASYYRVKLPGALCQQPMGTHCMIGGMPVYILESTTHSIRETR
ncbi:MAG: hypothetical protein RMK32_05765 [Anaerolineae bacterium]|nr:hypothetical protein [Thermoflexus sp.]MDW8065119.1 hypothetical protein [Anaerolineae bacterium]